MSRSFVSLTNAFSVALKKHSSGPYSLSFSLSLSVFSPSASQSLRSLSLPMMRRRRRDAPLCEGKISNRRCTHDFNARKPSKKFGARLFKDDARACVYATTTLATAFVKRRRRLYRARGTRCAVQSPKRTRVVCPFFVRLFFSRFRIKFARRKTQNSSWYVSLVASLSRYLSLSLNFCLFEAKWSRQRYNR